MPINRIDAPNSVPLAVGDYQAQNNQILALGRMGDVIPFSGSTMTEGYVFQVGGTLYEVVGSVSITGTVSPYVKITPAGATASAAFVANLSGVTWNAVYNGYYDVSGNRYIAQPWTWIKDGPKTNVNSIARNNAFGIINNMTPIAKTARSHKNLAYGNGIFVATYTNGFSYSTDGLSWNEVVFSGQWDGITYAEGLFVAVSNATTSAQKVATSPDGITWTLRGPSVTSGFFNVAYGNDIFVAVSHNSTTGLYSSDGLTWSTMTQLSTLISLTFGNGLFVAAGTNVVSRTANGTSWSSGTISTGNWTSMTYGDGVYCAVAGGATDKAAYSSDGITFTNGAMTLTEPVKAMFYNGVFYVMANGGVYRSLDAKYWRFVAIDALPISPSGAWGFGNGLIIYLSSDAGLDYIMVGS